MNWWIWGLAGLIFLAIELATPGGFFTIFFGAAALLVALLTGIDLISAQWLQWLTFGAASVAALLFFRKPLMERFKGSLAGKEIDSLLNETATALDDLAANGVGKVELRGTSWNARNVGTAPLAKGQRLKIEKVDGLMLSVRAEEPKEIS